MLVTIANFTEPYEAHLLRGRLEAEGIAAFVAHELHVGNNYPWGIALGGAKVQVHADLAREARAIERACIEGEYTREINAHFDQADETCPHCGSTDFRVRGAPTQIVLAIAFALFASIVFPPPQDVRVCRKCGTEWPRELAA